MQFLYLVNPKFQASQAEQLGLYCGQNAFYWRQICALDSVVIKPQTLLRSNGGLLTNAMRRSSRRNREQCIITENQSKKLKLIHYDETKKMANDSQIVRAKEHLKSSHDGPNQRQASGTNNHIKALRQGNHCVSGLTHRRAVKEEPIAIDRDWVYNQACRILHNIHVESQFFATFNYFLIYD